MYLYLWGYFPKLHFAPLVTDSLSNTWIDVFIETSCWEYEFMKSGLLKTSSIWTSFRTSFMN